MMMGTWLRLRSWRHTSMPDTLGSITSSRTRSGLTASNRSSAWAPSRATCTRKPSRRSPTVRASMKLSSSSTTSTVVSVTLISSSKRSATSTCLLQPGHRHGAGADRDPQREGRAGTFLGVDRDAAAVVGGHVAHDGQAQAGAARLPAAGPVDAVEALEDAVEVARRDADAVVPHDDVDPRAVRMGGHLDGAAGVGVLHAVLDQVGHRRHELAAIADGIEPARRLDDVDGDLALVGQVPDALD